MLPGAQDPKLVNDQLETLEELYRDDLPPIDRSVRQAFNALELESIHHVHALGDGDSYHAALAAEMVFKEFSNALYTPSPAMRFLEYGADYLRPSFPRDTLVLGISASGGSTRVVQSIERVQANNDQILTGVLVGKSDSPLGNAAQRVIASQIQEKGRTPGLRTYVASLMGLFGLAIRLGEIKRVFHMDEANALRKEIYDLAKPAMETFEAAKEPVKKAVELIGNPPFMSYTGSGPSFGTASFASAKVVEVCGIFAIAQDLEEWAHVERFAYPLDFPVVMIAPPGKGYWRAKELARAVKQLGHPLVAVLDSEDTEISPFADVVLPVHGKVRESFSPFLYYIGASHLAEALAHKLGRAMFMTDNEHVIKLREEMRRQIYG